MVKVTKSVYIEIEKDGQKITFGPDEIEDIKRQLDAAIREKGREFHAKTKARRKVKALAKVATVYHMSDDKKKEIINNVNKKLSGTPKTLSALLDGVSYVPNYLPVIRKMVESQQNVARKQVGKRTLYYLKDGKNTQ
ncbi:hypothetical protein [Candidatus Nitrososphaera evergladensis]|nr:hypothetical protein [Candidatus Nitrososphaera evergladensis]